MRWSVLVFFAWTENRKWGTDEPQRHDCSPQDSAAGLGCKGGGPAERAVGPGHHQRQRPLCEGPDHRSEPRGGPATGNHPLRSRQRLPRSGLTDPIYRKGRRDRGALFLLSRRRPARAAAVGDPLPSTGERNHASAWWRGWPLAQSLRTVIWSRFRHPRA